jgi:hypothetical protein
MVAMVERRHLTRFRLKLVTRILRFKKENNYEEINDLCTDNISAGGAYLITYRPLPLDTKVMFETLLPLSKKNYPHAKDSIVIVSGTVVRNQVSGMAILFDNDFQIVSLRKNKLH